MKDDCGKRYYITIERVMLVDMTFKQAKDFMKKYKGSGVLHLKQDPYNTSVYRHERR